MNSIISILSDFYWKKKWKIIHAFRRRGINLTITTHPKVPTVGITGSVGKTTTSRMVADILAAQGKLVALATTQGAFIGREVIRFGDSAGGEHARRLLRDHRIEIGVFELARGGLIRDGMVLSGCNVGAVLNIQDNHIGLDGVRSREDLAKVKAIVVENTREMAVLNADDDLCLAMRERVTAKRLCLVSMRHDNVAVLEHVARGGVAVFLDECSSEPKIKIQNGDKVVGSLGIAEIPATLGGLYRPAVINALFASAISVGMGIDCDGIWGVLRGFTSSRDDNPGRMNFFEGLPYTLLITRASSPQAMAELANFVKNFPSIGAKHLMFCMVGDRPDDFLCGVAHSAAFAFDTYICSDWEDLRNRPPGTIADILARGLLESGVPPEQITVAPCHDEALRMAFSRARAGDFLAVVTVSHQKAWDMAEQLRQSAMPS